MNIAQVRKVCLVGTRVFYRKSIGLSSRISVKASVRSKDKLGKVKNMAASSTV